MPWHMSKRGRSYRVVGGASGHITAKHTTKQKAQRQLNLLRGIQHGWKPSKR